MKKCIICKGGLGNQMFQYAFYIMMSHFHKCELDLALYDLVNMHNGYELPLIFKLKQNEEFTKSNKTFLRLLLRWKRYPIFIDRLHYIPNIEMNTCKYFDGYWQSEKWFERYRYEVLNAFEFKSISSKNLKAGCAYSECESVSLHIRRGDYLESTLYANCADLNYYEHAIAYIKKIIPNAKFFVFSNDIKWCRENITNIVDGSIEFVDWNKGKEAYQDMYLMAHCKHNIIANSSFSWWGAYLNDNPHKIVIAPSKWYNRPFNDYKDIIPESWIKI